MCPATTCCHGDDFPPTRPRATAPEPEGLDTCCVQYMQTSRRAHSRRRPVAYHPQESGPRCAPPLLECRKPLRFLAKNKEPPPNVHGAVITIVHVKWSARIRNEGGRMPQASRNRSRPCMLVRILGVWPPADIKPQVASQFPNADTNELAITGNHTVMVSVAMHPAFCLKQFLRLWRIHSARPSRVAITSTGTTFCLVPECCLQVPLEGS